MRVSRRIAAFLLVFITAFGLTQCRTAIPPPDSAAQRVILISYDGTSFDDLERLQRENKLSASGLNRMRAEGAFARVIPINPTLTSPAHISIATGATPQQTGIVSNSFHAPGKPRTASISGFDAPIDVETLWEAARRQGKQVGVVTFPGADGNGPRRTADWGLIYTHPITRSRIVELTAANFSTETRPAEGPPSFSPVQHTLLRWEFETDGRSVSRDVTLLVFDTTNDGVKNYDDFRILSEEPVTRDANRWFAVSTSIDGPDGPALYGSWSKLLELDPELDRVLVYWGTISRNKGYPAAYRQMIDREVGFWPGPPDDRLSQDWLERRAGIDPDTYSEQIERFSTFLTKATLLSMQRMPWDLILSYQPVVDETQHQFRLVNDRQLWSTPENRQLGLRMREHAYRIIDQSVAQIIGATRQNTSVIVTGDHGLAAQDTSLRLNRLLVDWGFASVSDKRLAADTRWAAFPSSSMVNIYAFEPRPGETEELIQRLRELRAPDGELFFERVNAKQPEDHANSGDIIAFAYPRFTLVSGVESAAFAKTRHFGAHGGLNHHREYHTVFGAIGPGVRKVPPELSQTEIAAYVSLLMGMEPPRQARPWNRGARNE